jgi:transcription-repair coupling factor (superfamily II helicase)
VDHVVVVPVRETFGGSGDDDELVAPTTPALDFFSVRGVRLLVCEHEQVAEQAVRVRDQLEASFGDGGGRARSYLPPPSEAFVTWDDLADRLGAAPMLEELAVGESGPALREVRCQPAMEFHGRVGDWIADLRQARERGDTVLFVADSAGRAERAVEILRDYDVVAVPVERAEGRARRGGAGGRWARCPRVPAGGCRAPGLRRARRLRRGAPGRRQAAWHRQGVSLRSPRSQGRRSGRHVDHGIGEFVGLKQLGVSGSDRPQEFLELRYQDDAKLFVPSSGST